MDIDRLPDLCLNKILCSLDSKTLVSCYHVNKRWRKMITSTRRIRETLAESIDVSAEFENLPLDKFTRAKIGEFEKFDGWVFRLPRNRYDFTFFRFFTVLTHLEIDVDLSFEHSEAVLRLRDTLTSLSLGPNVPYDRWVNFWKDNPRLEKLEIVSVDVLYLEHLPKTLKSFVAIEVQDLCLQPCRESLTHLKITRKLWGTRLATWSFDRLKKLSLCNSDRMPGSAPILEHFECWNTQKNCILVKNFVCQCHSTLTELIVPLLILDDPLPSFPNLEKLSVRSLTKAHHPFPALKSFAVHDYNHLKSTFPDEAFGIERLTVVEESSRSYVKPNNLRTVKKMKRFLKTLCRLNTFGISGSVLVKDYLKWVPLSNLKRLKVWNLRDVYYLDLSRFAIESLHVTAEYSELTVKLPSIGLMRELTLEGKVRICEHCHLIKIERLTCNSFFIDRGFLRRCLARGLVTLRINTGRRERECPESFFEALEDGLFAVYASVHKDFRNEFERKIRLVCPSVRVCNLDYP